MEAVIGVNAASWAIVHVSEGAVDVVLSLLSCLDGAMLVLDHVGAGANRVGAIEAVESSEFVFVTHFCNLALNLSFRKSRCDVAAPVASPALVREIQAAGPVVDHRRAPLGVPEPGEEGVEVTVTVHVTEGGVVAATEPRLQRREATLGWVPEPGA